MQYTFDFRWIHLPKVLELGNVKTITNLGYLSNADKCSRMIDNYLTESEKTENAFETTLEDIAFEMFESIGIESAMKILMEKSSNFKKGTFSAR